MSTPNAIGSAMQLRSTRLPIAAYLWAIVAVVASLATTNPLLTAAAIIELLLLAWLLWRPGEPPVLLFAAGYQWTQVSTLVFLADYQSKPVSRMDFSPTLERAIWLGLLGLIALGLGLRLGVRRLGGSRPAIADSALSALSVNRVFALYGIFALFSAAIPYLVWKLLPIAQILFALASLKWVFYMLLGYITLLRRTRISYFVIATVAEFIAGIGFFSGFKTVFFICGLLILSVHLRVNLRMIVATLVVVSAIVLAGLAWMTIREDYRNFLNQGTGQQVILVSPLEQVEEFGTLVSQVDAEDLQSSVSDMFTRLAYVDYFAAVLDYVPAQRPFEGGRLLVSAIRHLLLPRFLDPNKEVLESDSEITMRYTGLTVASSDQGTSIGIGYMAEGYVDFGVYGMLVLVLIFGFLWGRMYAWLVSHSRITATGLAFGTALIIDASQFEMAETKLLGGMVAKFLVFAVVMKYVVPKLHTWMSAGKLSVPAVMGIVPIDTLADSPAIGLGAD